MYNNFYVALDWEGIYRISGSKEDVLLLQERFDEGNSNKRSIKSEVLHLLIPDNNLDLKVLDSVVTELPYTVASALKNFFRLLPDALIADEIAEKLLEVKGLFSVYNVYVLCVYVYLHFITMTTAVV